MRECHEDSEDEHQPPPRNPSRGSGTGSAAKWWHVADTDIEEMVQKLNAPQGPKAKASKAPALRQHLGTRPSVGQRSVRFEDSLDQALRENAVEVGNEPRQQPADSSLDQAFRANVVVDGEEFLMIDETRRQPTDSLDQALGESAVKVANEKRQEGTDSLDLALRERLVAGYVSVKETRPKRGTWKVSDARIIEMIAQEHKAQEAAEQSDAGPLGRSGSDSFLTSGSTHKSDSRSLRRRHSDSKIGLSTQLELGWNKDTSTKLFANCGIGLDGKGNKVIKPGVVPFNRQTIFLSDVDCPSLERVRVAVTGHRAYMKAPCCY